MVAAMMLGEINPPLDVLRDEAMHRINGTHEVNEALPKTINDAGRASVVWSVPFILSTACRM